MNTIHNPEVDPDRTIGRASAETEALTKFLSETETGQVITYTQMQQACKADVQQHPSHLNTARRRLLKAGIAFGTIIGVGIKRLADGECPDEAEEKQKRARRMAKRGLAILDCGDLAKMDPETKIKAITQRTVLSFMSGASSRKTINLANQAARISNGEMKIGKIEELFRK